MIRTKIRHILVYINSNDRILDIYKTELVKLFSDLYKYPNIFDVEMIQSRVKRMFLIRVDKSRILLALDFIKDEIIRLNAIERSDLRTIDVI
jgi:hypothetical protein